MWGGQNLLPAVVDSVTGQTPATPPDVYQHVKGCRPLHFCNDLGSRRS